MGVTHLWQILQSIAKPIKISDLKNKILAIDLSIWICENSTVKYNSLVLKPHLRNLFFRCKHLLEIGCVLIFVREGDVIELKRDTMEKRNNNRFGKKTTINNDLNIDSYEDHISQITESLSIASNKPKIKKRSNFETYINECCELLNYMGIAVIRSPCGEAEKSCAYLNLINKCDGVISEDSDVFLYGAKIVYRNFCIDKKTEISIEEYKASDIELKLGYTREMLVVLSLFLGCDYDTKGVPGCGVQLTNKFFNEIKELEKKKNIKIDVLNLIRNWQSNDYQSSGIISEDKIRKLVLNNIEQIFPNEKIIREYLYMDDDHKKYLNDEFNYNHKWRRPNLKANQKFNEHKQTWEYKYTCEKIIPLIILYEYSSDERSIYPINIVKIRKQAGIEYYEVRWSKMNENNSWNDRDLSDLNEYTTLEKIDVFEMYYPIIVDEFKKGNAEKKTKKSKKKEKVNEIKDDIVNDKNENYDFDNVSTTQKEFKDESIIVLDDDAVDDNVFICSEESIKESKDTKELANVNKVELNEDHFKVLEEKIEITNNEIKENFYREKKSCLSDNNNKKDELIILSSDDESEKYTKIKNKNDDIQNLLEKFVSLKLESIRKPMKKIEKSDQQTTSREKFKSITEKILNENKEINDVNNLNMKENLEFFTDKFDNKLENQKNLTEITKKDEMKETLSNEHKVITPKNSQNSETDLKINSPLPFSMRMKKVYKNASIFKN